MELALFLNFYLISFFWPHHSVCRILVPWPGIELVPPCSGSTESQSLDHQRFPSISIFKWINNFENGFLKRLVSSRLSIGKDDPQNHSLGVLNTFKSEKEFEKKKGLRTGGLLCVLSLITLPSFFISAPWYPTSDFSVILILKNFLQFFKISDCFSAMINTAYLSFLKILSSMTPNPSNFLSTFMITPSFSPLGPIPWDFFPFSCL